MLDPLAIEILEGRVPEGSHVTADQNGDRLAFTALAEAGPKVPENKAA